MAKYRFAVKTRRCVEMSRDFHISRETFDTPEQAYQSAKDYFINIVEIRVVKANRVNGSYIFVDEK